MRSFFVVVLLAIATNAFAQQGSAIELLRQDIKTEKMELMAGSLPLTEKQSAAFWPIYRDYDHELSKLADRRIAIIKQVAVKADSMDRKTADAIVKESFSIADARNSLLKKYYARVSKALGPVLAARFLQIENQMLTLLDAQIIDQIPLVKAKGASEKTK
jgi:Spy/CpxP family protein refolding chaperone